MASINKQKRKNLATGPIETKKSGKVQINHEGGIGYARKVKSELFLAVISNLNENKFYESADEANERIRKLVKKIVKKDDDGGLEFFKGIVSYLVKEASLRTVPIILAAEAVHERLSAGYSGGNRELLKTSLTRLDQPSELIAYWHNNFGRKLPSAVKRAISDMLNEKANEYSVMKWTGKTNRGNVSLRDVLNLTHAKPKDERQSALYRYVLDSAYGRDDQEVAESMLPRIYARKKFLEMDKESQIKELSGDNGVKLIRDACLTHEVIASQIGKIPLSVWKNLVPEMGTLAIVLNLRRMFQSVEVGNDDELTEIINNTLKSRSVDKLMPIQLVTALEYAPDSMTPTLARMVNESLANVPSLPSRTLILVDISGSMICERSLHSCASLGDVASVFGLALALKAENADLFAFNNEVHRVITKTNKLHTEYLRFPPENGGTRIGHAITETFDNHDRVIILTDEQSSYYSHETRDGFLTIPEDTQLFVWNLAGYRTSFIENGPYRHTFGGLNDSAMNMIQLLERGVDQKFPWED